MFSLKIATPYLSLHKIPFYVHKIPLSEGEKLTEINIRTYALKSTTNHLRTRGTHPMLYLPRTGRCATGQGP